MSQVRKTMKASGKIEKEGWDEKQRGTWGFF